VREEALLSPSFLQRLLHGQVFKDDVNGFSSTSDICFMDEGQGKRSNTALEWKGNKEEGGRKRELLGKE
jgi:hypothetical protein